MTQPIETTETLPEPAGNASGKPSGKTYGMVLGKFLPPHKGHVYLIEFAKNFVDDLTVVVDTMPTDPIHTDTRCAWIRQMFPSVRVVRLKEPNPQEPKDHPQFWEIWQRTLLDLLPHKLDYVFASEQYGWKLAEVLGAQFVGVDPGRNIMPTSGTACRNDPFANWDYLPSVVRAHFVRKVCIFGPESTGKSTLALNLAKHYKTISVPEYGRTWTELRQGQVNPEDIEIIARGQLASEDALAQEANKIMFCDTDLLTTTIWSDWLFGSCPQWIKDKAVKRRYDLHLLLDVDVPYVEDIVRYLPDQRIEFFERCQKELEVAGRPYVKISGTWDKRLEQSIKAVDNLLKSEFKWSNYAQV
jgi:NadR type nicotinamide-nucleotide adenylyltransferase